MTRRDIGLREPQVPRLRCSLPCRGISRITNLPRHRSDEVSIVGLAFQNASVEAIFADTDVPADQEEWIARKLYRMCRC